MNMNASTKSFHGINPLRATINARKFFSINNLGVDNLVQVVLVTQKKRESFLPHTTLDGVVEFIKPIVGAGIPAIKLFTEGVSKRDDGKESVDENNLTNQALRLIRNAFPKLYVMTENCLCPYTTHGSCAVHNRDGHIDAGATADLFVKAALLHAENGADAVGPAAMAEGLVEAVRNGLDTAGYNHIGVVPHLIINSYAYGPFRDLMQTGEGRMHRPSFQVNKNDRKAVMAVVEGFTQEGATAIMFEPGLHINDLIYESSKITNVPLGAFSTSAEYRLIVDNTRSDFPGGDPVLEHCQGIMRSGARFIVTYAAQELATLLSGSR
ncbi:hypothetical protein EHS39_37075 [Ensifer sp. MPMI2T]|nr:hypothetical protein EHS39_37075 [Ensifer sp. MPMI2T]